MVEQINFLELYQKVFEIIPQGNFEALMEAIYTLIDTPILAVDITYHVLGIAPKQKTGDPNWDYLLEHQGFDTDRAIQQYKDGVMQSANKQTTPYIINWGGHNKEFPKVQGTIRINGTLEGYVTMQFTSDHIPNDYLKAMEIIQQACEIMFKNLDSESSMSLAHQKAFCSELFNGRIHTKKQLNTWLKDTPIKLTPPYRMITISTQAAEQRNVLSYIRKMIPQSFPQHLALIQHNVLYILQYHLSTCIENHAAEKAVHALFNQFNAFCGISNPFDDVLRITDYEMQALDAMRLGRKTNSKYHLYFYEDFYLPAILAPRIEQMPPVNYISPIITTVRDYDKKHATDLFYTLDVYIKNLCNTAEAADKLHIHRNSLLYRINKIQELTNASLKEYNTFMHLLLSLYMMEYQYSED